MLELAILGLLEDHELHGYEMRKRLRAGLGLLVNVSFGSLYPALARLERAGALRAVEWPATPAKAHVPMTGSLSGERAALAARRVSASRSRRSRKVYRITDEGRRVFAELLDREPPAGSDDTRGFDLRLAFARHLPPQARLRLLERRRARLAQQLLDARDLQRTTERLDTYTRSVVEHAAQATEHDISWLDHLIKMERSVSNEAPTSELARSSVSKEGDRQ